MCSHTNPRLDFPNQTQTRVQSPGSFLGLHTVLDGPQSPQNFYLQTQPSPDLNIQLVTWIFFNHHLKCSRAKRKLRAFLAKCPLPYQPPTSPP